MPILIVITPYAARLTLILPANDFYICNRDHTFAMNLISDIVDTVIYWLFFVMIITSCFLLMIIKNHINH